MANKRISELAQIIYGGGGGLDGADLLLVADVSEFESKKTTLSDLSSYVLSNGNLTGSFSGTASYAQMALSATYAPTQASCSYANTSSWALNAITSSHTLNAYSASYSLNSSNAVSASYASTSSIQFVLTSALATLAESASYLIYNGSVNGTSSFAISASWARGIESSSYCLTSSRASEADLAISASWADTASVALNAITAAYADLVGTATLASFATVAATSYIAQNGVLGRFGVWVHEYQTGFGATEASPDTIIGLHATMSATKDAPTYLINMSVAVGSITGVSLWRSQSFAVDQLIRTIGVASSSVHSVDTITVTFLDTPTAAQGDITHYYGRVHNVGPGNYHVHKSADGLNIGTSSMTIIEF